MCELADRTGISYAVRCGIELANDLELERTQWNAMPFARNGVPTLTPRRRPKITRNKVILHGITVGCRGCKGHLGEGKRTNHNDRCRKRFDNINKEEESNQLNGPADNGDDGDDGDVYQMSSESDPDMPDLIEPTDYNGKRSPGTQGRIGIRNISNNRLV